MHFFLKTAQNMPMSQTQFSTPMLDSMMFRAVILRRIFAFLLDSVFIILLGMGVVFAISILGVLTFGFGWMAFHIIPWFPLLYYIFLIGMTGATPGQRLLGLTLRQDHNGSLPTVVQACVWSLLLWVSFALAGLPLLLVFFNRRCRAAHDVLSGLTLICDH